MAGLVEYASSDESSYNEEERQSQTLSGKTNSAVKLSSSGNASNAPASEAPRENSVEENVEAPPALSIAASLQLQPEANENPAMRVATIQESEPGSTVQAGGLLIGPSRPPENGGVAAFAEEDRTVSPVLLEDDGNSIIDDEDNPSLSPYSAERAAVRQLTLPRVPDFDIPGSPVEVIGDDDEAAALAARDKKFETFLELKQKRDTHFNARLAESEAMRNPALMDKLMLFVGLPPNAWGVTAGDDGDGVGKDEAGKGGSGTINGALSTARSKNTERPVDVGLVSAQYATTLPLDLWDPRAFPAEAFRRSLRRLQEDVAKQRARAPGERVEFVAATTLSGGGMAGVSSTSGSERRSRAGIPLARGSASITRKRKTRFD